MAEHDYDEIQQIELDYRGYTKTFNRRNRTPNEQQNNSIIRNTWKKRKRCVFLWIGIFIGILVSGITIFLVVKYGGILSYDGYSCLWKEWTEWTECSSFLTPGNEKRVQIYTGHGHNCKQKEKVETRACNDNVSSCFWTAWTSWTPCKHTFAPISKQTRIQIFTGYSKSCVEKDRMETKSCYDRTLDIRFDPNTLYSTCFLSKDLTILSNRKTDRTPYNPQAGIRFKLYQGAMLYSRVEKSTSFYYDISFQYIITSNLYEHSLILELGIGERNKLDNSHIVGDKKVSGWSFHLARCLFYNAICLEASEKEHNTLIGRFSHTTAGTKVNGTLGMLINRERNTLALFYNDTVVFTFHDVLSNVSLCPVFGVYNPNSVHVDLQIVSVGNITFQL